MLWASWIKRRPPSRSRGALLFLLEHVCVECSVMSEESRPNIYYSPEAYGLKALVDVDFADSYEFDILVAFVDPVTSVLYIGSDSGCSCPSPFEEHDKYSFEPCTSMRDVQAYLDKHYAFQASKGRLEEEEMEAEQNGYSYSRNEREKKLRILATFQEAVSKHVFTQKAKEFARLNDAAKAAIPDPF